MPREVSRQEIEGAFITEADLRLALTNMGAELTDEEVSDLVRVIRDAGGVHIGDEGDGHDGDEEL